MNKYIIELLKLQGSVILPGLGALMVTNSKTGAVSFNRLLKFNDGALAKFIAQQEGVLEQDALNRVAKLVREIEADVSKGTPYEIFGFGKFTRKAGADVEFELTSGDAIAQSGVAESTKKSESKSVNAAATAKADYTIARATADKKAAEEKKRLEDESAAAKALADSTAAKAIADKNAAEEKKRLEDESVAAKALADERRAAIEKELADKRLAEKKASDERRAAIEKELADKRLAEKKASDERRAAIEKELADKRLADSVSAKALVDKSTDAKATVDKQVESPIANVVPPKVSEEAKKIDQKIEIATASKVENLQEQNKFVPEQEEAEKVDKSSTAKASEDKKKDKRSDKKQKESEKQAKAKSDKAIAVREKAEAKAKAKADKAQAKADKKNKKGKRKRSFMPWLIIIIILGGGGTAAYFYRYEIDGFLHLGLTDEIPGDSTVAEIDRLKSDTIHEVIIEEVAEIDTMAIDSSTLTVDPSTEETVEEVVETVTPVSSGSGGAYHLIGGAFGSQANAEKYIGDMKAKGYPASILGQFNGLYQVSIKSFESRSAAQAAIAATGQDNVWIKKVN